MWKVALLGAALVGLPLVVLANGGSRPTGGSGIWAILRNRKADFQRKHPCPVNGKAFGYCPGYEIGFIVVPRNGGSMSEDNMRWMTTDEYEASHQPFITQ